MNRSLDSRLRVTTYDRVSVSLVTAILVFGFLFSILFAIWWTRDFQTSQTGPGDLEPVRRLPLTDVSLEQYDFLLDPIPPTAAPRLSQDLAAVANIVSTVRAADSVSPINGRDHSQGTRETGPIGIGGGTGIQILGTLTESKRWSLVYENTDFEDYVQMLHFFDVELGVVRLTANVVVRIEKPGINSRAVTSSRAAENSSFYFHNSQPNSRRWDTKIARDANVVSRGSALVHFYSEQSLKRFRAAELNRIADEGKSLEDVQSTTFSIRSVANGYEVVVDEIKYR